MCQQALFVVLASPAAEENISTDASRHAELFLDARLEVEHVGAENILCPGGDRTTFVDQAACRVAMWEAQHSPCSWLHALRI